MRILEAVQMPITSGIQCRHWVPGASVLMCVFEDVQMPILSGKPCRLWVPGCSIIMCVFEGVKVRMVRAWTMNQIALDFIICCKS